jgi:hypothetical protein
MWKHYEDLYNKSKNDNVEIISIDNINFENINKKY